MYDISEITNTLICGDTIEELKKIPNESIQMSMCSPPYWGLRNYQIAGQYGLEKSPQDYIDNMRNVFKEVYRVLKKDGTCWVNIGDTYCSQPPGNKFNDKHQVGDGLYGRLIDRNAMQEDNAKNIIAKRFDKQKYGGKNSIESGRGRGGDYKDKCMLMMPERFAFMMIDLGFILRNKIVWYKRNAMPSSVRDRFTNCWEYVYFFSKSRKYYFDLDSIRIPCTSEYNKFSYRVRDAVRKKGQPQFKASEEEIKNYRNKTADQSYKIGGMKLCPEPNDPKYKYDGPKAQIETNDKRLRYPVRYENPFGRNPGDHWDITTKGYKGAHFAVYPEKLCEMPIKASSKPNDIILDPFAGSCTTCVVAKKLGRNYIGIDLQPNYIKLAQTRLDNTIKPMF